MIVGIGVLSNDPCAVDPGYCLPATAQWCTHVSADVRPGLPLCKTTAQLIAEYKAAGTPFTPELKRQLRWEYDREKRDNRLPTGDGYPPEITPGVDDAVIMIDDGPIMTPAQVNPKPAGSPLAVLDSVVWAAIGGLVLAGVFAKRN